MPAPTIPSATTGISARKRMLKSRMRSIIAPSLLALVLFGLRELTELELRLDHQRARGHDTFALREARGDLHPLIDARSDRHRTPLECVFVRANEDRYLAVELLESRTRHDQRLPFAAGGDLDAREHQKPQPPVRVLHLATYFGGSRGRIEEIADVADAADEGFPGESVDQDKGGTTLGDGRQVPFVQVALDPHRRKVRNRRQLAFRRYRLTGDGLYVQHDAREGRSQSGARAEAGRRPGCELVRGLLGHPK